MRMACKGNMSSTGVLSTLQIRCGGSDELVHFCTVFSEHGVMRTGVCFQSPLTNVLRLCICTMRLVLFILTCSLTTNRCADIVPCVVGGLVEYPNRIEFGSPYQQ